MNSKYLAKEVANFLTCINNTHRQIAASLRYQLPLRRIGIKTSVTNEVITPILFKSFRANISSVSINFASLRLHKGFTISKHTLFKYFSSYLLPCKFSRHLNALSLIKYLSSTDFRLGNTLRQRIYLSFIKLNTTAGLINILYGFVNQMSGIINIDLTFTQLLFILLRGITITNVLADSLRISLAYLRFKQSKLGQAHHCINAFLNTACNDFTSTSVAESVGNLRISDLGLNRLT